jgi:DNA mismatch endonuclease (patch repair protein)
MVDNLSPASRRRAMAAVKSAGTTPERVVEVALKQLGYRFRQNDPSLPGKPDFVLRRKRMVILVHGCYWHGHHCARGARQPKTNQAYWRRKISSNRARDKKSVAELRKNHWRVIVIWECQTKAQNLLSRLAARLARYDRI